MISLKSAWIAFATCAWASGTTKSSGSTSSVMTIAGKVVRLQSATIAGKGGAAAERVLETPEHRVGCDDQDQREAGCRQERPQHEYAADRQDGQHHQSDSAFDPAVGQPMT